MKEESKELLKRISQLSKADQEELWRRVFSGVIDSEHK